MIRFAMHAGVDRWRRRCDPRHRRRELGRGGRSWRAPSAWLAAVLALAAPRPAAAQSNEAHADELFRRGQALLQSGRIREACELLGESLRLDPALGTLLNLAVCHEREGRTATAYREYAAAALWADSRHELDREQFARQRVTDLAKQVPRIRIDIAGRPVDVRAMLDGRLLDPSELETEIAVDPGHHRIYVTARGKRPWTRSDVRAELRGTTILHVALEDEAPLSAARSSTGPDSLGLVVGGVSVAALGAGVALLLRAHTLAGDSRREADKANATSPPDPASKAASSEYYADAVTHQTIGFVSLGAGVVGLGAWMYLLLGSRNADPTPASGTIRVLPALGPSQAGLVFDARL